jgi:hypothetical protein
MYASLKFLTIITFITLAACSTQETKQDATTSDNSIADPIEKSQSAADSGLQISGKNPPLTIMKGKKKLTLVRIMDGGICKNETQGVKGSFLLYADPNDIKRIKQKKGTGVFRAFETKIQELTADVLHEAIEKTNLSEDPFALSEEDAQQKLVNELVKNFRIIAADPIKRFQKDTSLTIDIIAFPPSLVFYQKSCVELQSTETDNQ